MLCKELKMKGQGKGIILRRLRIELIVNQRSLAEKYLHGEINAKTAMELMCLKKSKFFSKRSIIRTLPK